MGEGDCLAERLMFHGGVDFIGAVDASYPAEAEQGDGDDGEDKSRGCVSGVAGVFAFLLDHGEGGEACGEGTLEREPEGVHGGGGQVVGRPLGWGRAGCCGAQRF
ncbi:MAG: hypothetical protein RI897_772 [Verrucomicrobiota bacterium]